MNYRHIYHAGNFADVIKHITIIALMERLKLKEAGFFILDAFAGLGIYDLKSSLALKTNEADLGINKLYNAKVKEPILQTYLDIVKKFNKDDILRFYPGSPFIVSALQRAQDRLIANELHEEDNQTLKENVPQVRRKFKVLNLDAYQAIKANIPPKEKRGLIIIDPAFEDKDEFNIVYQNLVEMYKKWPTGVFMIWFPIKDNLPVKEFYQNIKDAKFNKVLLIECSLPKANISEGLNSCGVMIVNTPWLLKETLINITKELKTQTNYEFKIKDTMFV